MMLKRVAYVGLLALTAGLFLTPVLAEDDDKKFTITGEARTRWEYFDNVADFSDHTASGTVLDDSYDIWPYRVRIAAEGQFSNNVRGHVELQNFGYFGNEAPFKAFPDPIFQIFNSGGEEDTSLYQGFLEMNDIGGSSISLRIGRQEHTLGNELQMGDLDFYNGLSFDGVRSMFDYESFDLDLFYYIITEANAGCLGFCGDENLTFAGATADWSFGNGGAVFEPYALFYRNGSQTGATIAVDKFNIWTIGGRYSRSVQGSAWDWNIEAAFQTGDIGPNTGPLAAEEDHSANIIEGWVGYSWNNHRVHVGTLISSGDDDAAAGAATDGDHEDYLFLFTDVHANNRLGDMDLETFFFSFAETVFGPFFASGITDYNFGYTWNGGGRHGIMAAYHDFTLSEDAALGGPALTDDLGSEIDFRYTFRYSKDLGLEVGVAQFMPGDAIFDVFGDDDDAMRVWAQARLRW